MPYDLTRLEKLPTQPGVYLMKNNAGDVIYVGKAKNLRLRIKQYFMTGGDGRLMVPLLVSQIETIDILLVFSEKEALLLENNLIKQYKPKYNALLKDDKSYIALKVNHRHPWPQVSLVRYKGKPPPDGIYFGPYTSAHAARATLEMIQKIFPLRQCNDQEFARRTRPCILYDMKRCVAPCVQKCTKEQYEALVEKVIRFLKGQDKEILKQLYEEMESASNALEFERAGIILSTIRQIEKTVEGQSVDKPLGADADALGIYRQGEEVILTKLEIRAGKLMNSFHFNFSNIAQDDAELLGSFILQHYEKQELLPHEILLPATLENDRELSEILSINRPRKVALHTPQKGEKKNLIAMAYVNAEAVFKEKKDKKVLIGNTLLEMQEKFRLSRLPVKIECFDNSNIFGTESVSCLVAFLEGEKDKSNYRKFKVKTVEGPDDYATFYEVLIRRYKRAKDENNLPDLLIVDGGKGHLNVALKALTDLDIVSVDVISVAKESGRHDKGLTSEQVFLPNVKDPIILRHTSQVLFLLQRIRDEAHRFAVAFHRNRRAKRTLRTELIEIPGVGPIKSKRLLKQFGSVKKLKEASEKDLKQVKGLSEKDRQAILRYFSRF